jgi:predicted ArsR family transcriptional regulator
VCDSVPDKTPDWETAFDALFKHVTTYTHLRRLLILRCLAKEETCAAERIRSVVGMSADATRRQLDKLQRRGIIARLPTAGDKWALVRTAQPACRRRLLAIVLRALRAA